MQLCNMLLVFRLEFLYHGKNGLSMVLASRPDANFYCMCDRCGAHMYLGCPHFHFNNFYSPCLPTTEEKNHVWGIYFHGNVLYDMTRVGPTSLHVIPCNTLEHLPLPIWSLDVIHG